MRELLDNKKILIVGAGGLLGSQLVVGALSQGAKVIAADIDIFNMKEQLTKLGVDISSLSLSFLTVDVTNEKSVNALFSDNIAIDGAVNATYPRNASYGAHFFDVTMASFNENLALHLGGAFLFTQQCAVYFKKNKKPFSLVNISSVYGVVAPDFSVYNNTDMTMPVEYAAIKSALLHLNKYIAKYINHSDFRINSVSPGGIFDFQPEVFLEAYKVRTHGTGMLDVNNILGTVLFLLSEQSKYVVGQNIIVDDGFSL